MAKEILFDPHKTFFQLGIVRVTLLTVLTVVALLVLWIIFFSWEVLSYDPTYSGLNNLISIFKVPLGVSTLLIPIFAVYAANHRSAQTKETLRVTQKQNIFANRYKHIEEFDKYIKSGAETISNDLIVYPRDFYSICFDWTDDGDYKISEYFISHLKNYIETCVGYSRVYFTEYSVRSDYDQGFQSIVTFKKHFINYCSNSFSIDLSDSEMAKQARRNYEEKHKVETMHAYGYSPKVLMLEFIIVLKLCDKAIRFDSYPDPLLKKNISILKNAYDDLPSVIDFDTQKNNIDLSIYTFAKKLGYESMETKRNHEIQQEK